MLAARFRRGRLPRGDACAKYGGSLASYSSNAGEVDWGEFWACELVSPRKRWARGNLSLLAGQGRQGVRGLRWDSKADVTDLCPCIPSPTDPCRACEQKLTGQIHIRHMRPLGKAARFFLSFNTLAFSDKVSSARDLSVGSLGTRLQERGVLVLLPSCCSRNRATVACC